MTLSVRYEVAQDWYRVSVGKHLHSPGKHSHSTTEFRYEFRYEWSTASYCGSSVGAHPPAMEVQDQCNQ